MRRIYYFLIFPLLISGCVPTKKPLKFEEGSNISALQAGATGQDVLMKRCASCHHNGVNLGNFGSLEWNDMIFSGHMVDGNPEASRIYIRVADGTMPPSGSIPLEEVSLLWEYIKNSGQAPSNPTPTPTPTPPPVLTNTYSSIRQNILVPKCLSCHNSSQANNLGGGVNMDDYNGFRAQVNTGLPAASRVYVRGYNKTMPPNGVNALTNEELLTIYNWVVSGAPNN